jgi:hypothetical protein
MSLDVGILRITGYEAAHHICDRDPHGHHDRRRAADQRASRYLGSGAAVHAGAGFRVSPRWTIQAIVDRVPYYRDIDYLRFDGRVLFAAVKAAFLSRNAKVRPYFTLGAGVMDDDRIWINKRTVDPRLPRVKERSDLHYGLNMFTTSGGLDFGVSERTSIRAGLRLHGLLDTGRGRDLAPHTILQPTIGAAFRW